MDIEVKSNEDNFNSNNHDEYATIDLIDCIGIFLADEAEKANIMLDWKTGAQKGEYPIHWITKGSECA